MEEGIQYAQELGVPHQPIYDAADHFLNMTASQAIRDAAVGVICLMPKAGLLRHGKLTHLVGWLRPQIDVPKYLQRLNPGGLKAL